MRIAAMAAALCAAGMTLAADTLYTPTRSAQDQGISLKGWGSGTIAEADELAFEGTTSIRVSSRNFFQGGIINYSQPVSLIPEFGDKNNLLMMTMQVPGAGTTLGGGPAGGGFQPGGAGADAGGSGGAAAPGGLDERPGPGAPAGRGGGSAQQGPTIPIEKIRVIVTTSDGLKSEAFVDVKNLIAGENGWMRVGVPLQSINGFERTNKMVKSIAFASDTAGTFYIGEMNVLNDATPVFGEILTGEMNLALGDEVTYRAVGQGGATPLAFRWDFNAADGIQVDAEGQAVRYRFLTPGTFTITLTVQDQYGLKQAHSSTVKVVVNP